MGSKAGSRVLAQTARRPPSAALAPPSVRAVPSFPQINRIWRAATVVLSLRYAGYSPVVGARYGPGLRRHTSVGAFLFLGVWCSVMVAGTAAHPMHRGVHPHDLHAGAPGQRPPAVAPDQLYRGHAV